MIGFNILAGEPAKIERYILNALKLIIVSILAFWITEINIDLTNLAVSVQETGLPKFFVLSVITILLWVIIWEFLAKNLIEIISSALIQIRRIFMSKKRYKDSKTERSRYDSEFKKVIQIARIALLSSTSQIDKFLLEEDFDQADMIFMKERASQYFFIALFTIIVLMIFDVNISILMELLITGVAIITLIIGFFVTFFLKLRSSDRFYMYERYLKQNVYLRNIFSLPYASNFLRNYEVSKNSLKNAIEVKRITNDNTYPNALKIFSIGFEDDKLGNLAVQGLFDDQIKNEPHLFSIILSNIKLNRENAEKIRANNVAYIFGQNNAQLIKGLEELDIHFLTLNGLK